MAQPLNLAADTRTELFLLLILLNGDIFPTRDVNSGSYFGSVSSSEPRKATSAIPDTT